MSSDALTKIKIDHPAGTALVNGAALGGDARSTVEAILGGEPTKVFKDDRTRVWAVRVDGRGWVVKRFAASPILQLIGRSSPTREWGAAHRLAAIGVRVPEPVALVNVPRAEMLIMPLVEGKNLYHVIEGRVGGAEWRQNLARRVGKQVGVMAAHDIVNRDHKVGNLIVDEGGPVLIDPAGLRRRRTDGQVLDVMAHLYRTAVIAGPVSREECLACVEGLVAAMPRLGEAEAVFRAIADRL